MTETETVDYVLSFGGRCRDCADHFGICPMNGLPCDPDEARKAIEHVLYAVDYGLSNGYIEPGRLALSQEKK